MPALSNLPGESLAFPRVPKNRKTARGKLLLDRVSQRRNCSASGLGQLVRGADQRKAPGVSPGRSFLRILKCPFHLPPLFGRIVEDSSIQLSRELFHPTRSFFTGRRQATGIGVPCLHPKHFRKGITATIFRNPKLTQLCGGSRIVAIILDLLRSSAKGDRLMSPILILISDDGVESPSLAFRFKPLH